MMKRIIISGILGMAAGMAGCHSDTHLSTDVNSALLQSSATPVTVPVTIRGNVSCSDCDTGNGMAIVVSSSMMGNVANGLMNGIGSYSLSGVAKGGDTLTTTVTVSKKSGIVSKSAKAICPDGGGTLTQDFEF